MPRRILHHGPTPLGTPVILHDRAIQGCWFELHRQGGCGAAEVRLIDEFPLRHDIEPGDWISFETAPGSRCYLGRVEELRADSPAGIRLRLEGMSVQLNEVYPGGFGLQADGRAPHRYAATDLFSLDPDRSEETVDSVQTVEQVVRLLLSQYVLPKTLITSRAQRIEAPLQSATVVSMKFRGEETVRTILKELALRAQGAAWGVDASGEFFFLRPRDTIQHTFREGRDLSLLAETRDREHLFNRLLLTGDYVYDRREDSQAIARRTYRWRANFIQPDSRDQHGERRLRLWLPWVRTQSDAVAFSREFFRIYAQPTRRYLIETVPVSGTAPIPIPWNGRVLLEDRSGQTLIAARLESVRVHLDHAVRLRLELGPADPRTLWPEPPHDERWETPEIRNFGGPVTDPGSLDNSEPPPQSTQPPESTSPPPTSTADFSSSDLSSDDSSDQSSENSSSDSSIWTTGFSSQQSSGLTSGTDGNQESTLEPGSESASSSDTEASSGHSSFSSETSHWTESSSTTTETSGTGTESSSSTSESATSSGGTNSSEPGSSSQSPDGYSSSDSSGRAFTTATESSSGEMTSNSTVSSESPESTDPIATTADPDISTDPRWTSIDPHSTSSFLSGSSSSSEWNSTNDDDSGSSSFI